MDEQKKRLVELLGNLGINYRKTIADYLLKNGVFVLPCKVGDTVYWYNKLDEIVEAKIIKNGFCARIENGFEYDAGYNEIGKTVFLTREEAEAALAERIRGE